jgi:hypothetical protein
LIRKSGKNGSGPTVSFPYAKRHWPPSCPTAWCSWRRGGSWPSFWKHTHLPVLDELSSGCACESFARLRAMDSGRTDRAPKQLRQWSALRQGPGPARHNTVVDVQAGHRGKAATIAPWTFPGHKNNTPACSLLVPILILATALRCCLPTQPWSGAAWRASAVGTPGHTTTRGAHKPRGRRVLLPVTTRRTHANVTIVSSVEIAAWVCACTGCTASLPRVLRDSILVPRDPTTRSNPK